MVNDDAPWRRHAGPLLVLLLLALLEARLIFLVHLDHFGDYARTAREVVAGEGSAAAFQSRLLSTYAVHVVAAATGWSWRTAFAFLVPVFTVVASWSSYAAIHAWRSSPGLALRYAGGTSGLFVLLLDFQWFNLWDLLELAIHSAGALALFGRRPVWFFLAVCAIGVLNRESATFVALALLLSGIHRDEGRVGIEWKRAAAGLGAVAGALLLTALLRAGRFRGTPHALETSWGNLNKLDVNLSVLEGVLQEPLFTSAVVLLLPLTVVGWVVVERHRLTPNGWRALAVVGAMVVAHVGFADLLETRAMVAALPYLAFALLEVRHGALGSGSTDVSRT